MKVMKISMILLAMAALAQNLNADAFSAAFVQAPTGVKNGGQQVGAPGTGGVWNVHGYPYANIGGSFDPKNGVFVVPKDGFYHLDAKVLIDVAIANAPNQNANIQIVSCPAGNTCDNPCSDQEPAVILQQGGETWLGFGFTFAFPPNYALSASFNGLLNKGDKVAVCVDNWAADNAINTNCVDRRGCTFSGFSVNK